MKIERLVIENFKSIERIELVQPNPFTVFVGPNGSGKSNIFEGLEFVNSFTRVFPGEVVRRFGGSRNFLNRKLGISRPFSFEVSFDSYPHEAFLNFQFTDQVDSPESDLTYKGIPDIDGKLNRVMPNASDQFFKRFSRLFINSSRSKMADYPDDTLLNFSGSNLEQVLDRILSGDAFRTEVFEWLELFVPGFDYVSVRDRNELRWFEKSFVEHFTKDLISDGTYNILALLTAVYQSEEPQFLCIEEPENGLNPEVVKEIVNLCRYACERFGHFIWLNTHSQTLVSQLTADELVIVDKINGATEVKQYRGRDFHGLRMDEAWLMNVLGGGLPF